jgi:hypothetical protein
MSANEKAGIPTTAIQNPKYQGCYVVFFDEHAPAEESNIVSYGKDIELVRAEAALKLQAPFRAFYVLYDEVEAIVRDIENQMKAQGRTPSGQTHEDRVNILRELFNTLENAVVEELKPDTPVYTQCVPLDIKTGPPNCNP